MISIKFLKMHSFVSYSLQHTVFLSIFILHMSQILSSGNNLSDISNFEDTFIVPSVASSSDLRYILLSIFLIIERQFYCPCKYHYRFETREHIQKDIRIYYFSPFNQIVKRAFVLFSQDIEVFSEHFCYSTLYDEIVLRFTNTIFPF